MRFSFSALFSYGFRPFFLLAGGYAALSLLAWIAWLALGLVTGRAPALDLALPAYAWHAHEMLFGYAMAAVAGFLLTAVPSWTKREPIRGRLLAFLVAAWLLGRIAFWLYALLPPWLVAAADLVFVPFLAVLIGRALIAGWSRRNLIFLPIFVLLFAANLLVHLELVGVIKNGVSPGLILALNTFILLITLIGGRIVPAFTTNALRRAGETKLPRSSKALDIASVLLVAAVLISDLFDPAGKISGALALAAAVANGFRLAGWRGIKVLDQPILWIVHVAYAWLVIGLAIKAAANLSQVLSLSTALHALTVGAIGSMTLGVMTRAGLGHTGRPLVVAPSIAVAYGLVSLAAVIRVLGAALFPQYYEELMLVAGATWTLAFAIFTVVYWPILTRARVGQNA